MNSLCEDMFPPILHFFRQSSHSFLYQNTQISWIRFYFQLSSTAKVARWFQQLNSNPQSLSRPESGFVSGDSRSERNQEDQTDANNENKETAEDLCDEYLLVEGTNNLWSKLSAKKRRKLLGLKLGKITTF